MMDLRLQLQSRYAESVAFIWLVPVIHVVCLSGKSIPGGGAG